MGSSRRTIPHVTKAGAFGVSFGGPGVESWDTTRAWLVGAESDESLVTLDNAFERSSPIATAIEVIAQDAASIPWELFPKGSGDDAEQPVEHPIQQVWAQPNDVMLGSQLWVGTYVSRKLWGEAWWYYPDLLLPKATSRTNPDTAALERKLAREGGITLLDPRSVNVQVRDGEVVYTHRAYGVDKTLNPDRLTLFKSVNPRNPLRGLSEITQVLVDALGDRAAAAWNARYFNDQNGVPAGMLQPGMGQSVTAEQKNDILRLFNQQHGTKRAVGFLPGGWTWNDLGVTRRDMDFPELRSGAFERIVSRLGVPPFLVGMLEKADYANSRKQESLYWRSTITRFLSSIRDTLNYDFLPKMGVQLEAWPKMEVVRGLIEDMETLAGIADRFWRMGIPFEQINERLSLGFDPSKIPNSDVSFLPFSVLPSDQLMAPEVTDPPDELDAKTDNDGEAPPAKAPEKMRRNDKTSATTDRERLRRRLLWRQLQTQKIDLEARMNKAVRKWANDLKAEALAALDGTKGWLVRSGFEPIEKDGSFYLIDVTAAKVKLKKVTRPIYQQAVRRGGETVITEIGLTVNFDMQASEVLALIENLASRVVRITDTIANALRDTLREGLNASETILQLRDRVASVMGASLGRSLTIARTEIGMAFSGARFAAMKANGIQSHQWVSARDQDVREPHQPPLDTEVVALGVPFSNGLLYPLDPEGPPEEVCNCRCIAVAVVRSPSS